MSFAVIAEGVSILASLYAIFHCWSRARMCCAAKIFWTLFILLPLYGPVFYAFVVLNPDAHGESPGGPWA